jgi:hypothetical protein
MQYCAQGIASNRYVNVLPAAQTFSECAIVDPFMAAKTALNIARIAGF